MRQILFPNRWQLFKFSPNDSNPLGHVGKKFAFAKQAFFGVLPSFLCFLRFLRFLVFLLFSLSPLSQNSSIMLHYFRIDFRTKSSKIDGRTQQWTMTNATKIHSRSSQFATQLGQVSQVSQVSRVSQLDGITWQNSNFFKFFLKFPTELWRHTETPVLPPPDLQLKKNYFPSRNTVWRVLAFGHKILSTKYQTLKNRVVV